MNKYKIGDRVKIREDLEENKTYDGSSIIKNIKEKYGL